jgi:hypothetical protein
LRRTYAIHVSDEYSRGNHPKEEVLVTLIKARASIYALATSAALAITLITVPTMAVFADDINPGVFAIDARPFGQTYGQWSENWWRWAMTIVPNATGAFDTCPNEPRGPVFFLIATSPNSTAPNGTQANCSIPASTAILFPTFNVEWSAQEATAQGQATPGQTCFVTASPSGTSYAALYACARTAASQGVAGATLVANVDGRALQSLSDYRAHSTPPPFPFTAVSNNLFGLQPTPTQAVADGFWIMLMPLTQGKHTVHFGATIPAFGLSFEATDCLIVQPTNQTCA